MDRDALRGALVALLKKRFKEIASKYAGHWITATAELIIQLFEKAGWTQKGKGGE